MKWNKYIVYLLVLLCAFQSNFTSAQKIYASIPKKIDPDKKYLFYLHGRIVEEQGHMAVSPEYGPYKYQAILDTLKNYGFTVISEVRPRNTNEDLYAEKISLQIDTLLKEGIPATNIYVIGASKGAFITLFTSAKLHNSQINYVIMGICNEEDRHELSATIDSYCGNFLSIYETSDPFGGTCQGLLSKGKCISGFSEVKLIMNNKHGFLYQPYPQWVHPIMVWAKQNKQ